MLNCRVYSFVLNLNARTSSVLIRQTLELYPTLQFLYFRPLLQLCHCFVDASISRLDFTIAIYRTISSRNLSRSFLRPFRDTSIVRFSKNPQLTMTLSSFTTALYTPAFPHTLLFGAFYCDFVGMKSFAGKCVANMP